MEFSRQQYWSRLPFPPPGDLPDSGFQPAIPVFSAKCLFKFVACSPVGLFVFLLGSGSSLWSLNQIFYCLYVTHAAAAAKLRQSCPTLCDPIDGSLPGSPIPGILQARTLEWVAISFSNAWKWKVKMKSLRSVWLLVTPWSAAHQAPPPMGFSRQEYWNGAH